MNLEQIIKKTCACFANDSKRMIDILWSVQDQLGWISTDSMELIAKYTQTYRVEVEGVVSFYSFFHQKPQGKFIIYLCDDIIDRHAGMSEIEQTIKEVLGVNLGQTTEDGLFSFHLTPCIGMSDQAPAALINNIVVTKLSPTKIKKTLQTLKKHGCVDNLFKGTKLPYEDLIHKMVKSNIRKAGVLLLNKHMPESGLEKALSLYPKEIIETLQTSKLKGRGGAGYTLATKWRTAKNTEASESYVICNADEGEPGTFKDRVLLTEHANLLFEGMTIAAYAIGSTQGILYLRAEYRYLLPYLEKILEQRRHKGLLGQAISFNPENKEIFHFDIRIQLGAGAYVCGEESALISSCEGKRGEPKNRPPFPAEVGYLDCPTVVNNVETFCNVPLICEKGPEWFQTIGTEESKGTKLLSISGDCSKPGVYEFPFGITVGEVLKAAGAIDAAAVQVGGASGELIAKADFDRKLCFEDLPTAGAIMIFSAERNILEIVDYFMQFFIDESCGYCTPCRVGNVFLQKTLQKIRQGLGDKSDLDYLKQLSKTIVQTSRCGFGHTSPNPILSSMKNFPLVYSALLNERTDGLQAGFHIHDALNEARIIAKRRSMIYDPEQEATKESEKPI
jgi:[NiFe] hydrogenase diaphorase moiety large subunit